MIKKPLAMLIAAAVVQILSIQSIAASTENNDARRAEKVKAAILRLGTGRNTRIEVQLLDKTKLEGYISETNSESFVAVNGETGASTVITYKEVSRVKGHNLSTGAKIGIGIAIGVAAILIVIGALGGLSNR